MTYDVIAVHLKSHTVRLLANGKTKPNAEAIIKMAVYRRGVDTEFYTTAPAGVYHEGDTWTGSTAPGGLCWGKKQEVTP